MSREAEADKEAGQWPARKIAQQGKLADFSRHHANNNARAYPRADLSRRRTKKHCIPGGRLFAQ